MLKYIEEIGDYIPKNAQEIQDKKVILNCMQLFPHNILQRDNEIAHITCSGFILNKSLNRALMIHHNIRNAWSWTGGHSDGNPNLFEVAVREATEETGVNVKSISEDIASLDVLTVMGHVKNGEYVNSHLHLSIAYVLTADDNDTLIIKPDENSGVKWFPIEDITAKPFTARDAYLYTKLIQRAKAWS